MAQLGPLRMPSPPDPRYFYLSNTGLGTLWALIKEKFASKTHTHTASDITGLSAAATITIYRYTE